MQGPQHAGKSEADLHRWAGFPGGWCKCECLFLTRKIGRQERRTIKSPSENRKQEGLVRKQEGLSPVVFQQKDGLRHRGSAGKIQTGRAQSAPFQPLWDPGDARAHGPFLSAGARQCTKHYGRASVQHHQANLPYVLRYNPPLTQRVPKATEQTPAHRRGWAGISKTPPTG